MPFDLAAVNLSKADLNYASFAKAYLPYADLTEASLEETDFFEADLSESILKGAKFNNADLSCADLTKANFTEATLKETDLSQSILIETCFDRANLTGCRIYGVSVWNIKLNKTIQSELIITKLEEPTITVDNLEVAQFIYLLLNNEKIRNVIDTITSKVVLILGRFEPPERMAVLNAIKEKLRNSEYLPVLFNFDKPKSQGIMKTVSILAHMARFVIADYTDPKMVLWEVPHIIDSRIKVPVIPLIQRGSGDEHFELNELRIGITYLLDTYWYEDIKDMLTSFQEKVIIPAEEKSRELRAITKA